MAEVVQISWVLNEIKQSVEPFELCFVKKSTGEITRRQFINASKTPESEEGTDTKQRTMQSLKDTYSLLLTDLSDNIVKTIKISLIAGYNEYEVKH